MNSALVNTIGNEKWLRENEAKIREMLPETWTLISNIQFLPLGFQFKLLGIDWRSDNELAGVLVFFEKVGLLFRKDHLVRRNPRSIFQT